jgi:soluble lytic murein transglycosylase-like protein
MNVSKLFILSITGAIIYYIVRNPTEVQTAAQAAQSEVQAAMSGWKTAGEGPTWLPILNEAEAAYGLPTDMLARQAYQESSFIENVIRGIKKSSAGALGILQLMPQYFLTVNVPTPYTDTDVSNQISEAAKQMATLYKSTSDWSLALAAYNAGLGNVQKYGGIPPFPETQSYVASIVADVPALQV